MDYFDKSWFTERRRIYDEFSKRENTLKKTDSPFFYFNSPDSGWIQMEIYMNGKKCFTCDCSCVYDPFQDCLKPNYSLLSTQRVGHGQIA